MANCILKAPQRPLSCEQLLKAARFQEDLFDRMCRRCPWYESPNLI
jgi:hypothetical protein